MSINTQFALGVHLLTMLAASAPATLRSEAMAGSANANPVHIRRVLGRFREAGLVGSKPGVGGGTHLLRDPATITLAEVWRIAQGDTPVLGAYEGDPHCQVGSGMHSLLTELDQRAQRAIQHELRTTTIAQLVDRAMTATPPTTPS